ncbi:MAG: protein TolR [Chromatiaceae bacterium]|nr:MAG: protein TolR [Chromatiaceae bacterium]
MNQLDRRRRQRGPRPLTQINIVPYVDVMFVLLVAFMITAPLITQGVKVELPQAQAAPQPGEGEAPVVIHIDQFGDTYVDLGDVDLLPVDQLQLYERLLPVFERAPHTQILVRADAAVSYGIVVDAMVAAQAAGASSVGLITQPPTERRR